MKKPSILTHFVIWFIIASTLIYVFRIAGTESKLVGDVLQCAIALIALACGVANAYLQRKSSLRHAWLLLALGVGFVFIGYLSYAIGELAHERSGFFLTISRISAVPAYSILTTAFAAAIRTYRNKGAVLHQKGRIFIGTVVVATVLFATIIIPVLTYNSGLINQISAATAPIADFSLLLLNLILMQYIASIHLEPEGRAWRIIAGGLFVLALTDSIYSLLVTRGSYHTGMLIDLGWILGLALLAIGLSEQIKVSGHERAINKIRQAFNAKLAS